MNFKFKYVFNLLFLCGVCLFSNTINAFAMITYHSTKESEIVTKGVEYTYDTRMVGTGVLNVHVLTVDLTDETLSVKGVESAKAPGLRETTKTILSDHGAVAGINSDFFHMTSLYTISFGPLVNDGELVSASANMNKGGDEFSSFFIDDENNMFFSYFSMNAGFSNGVNYIRVGHMNKVDSIVDPVYIDRAYGVDTSVIDNNVDDNVVKIVVEDDIITKISSAGETVNIPENGYVILVHNYNYVSMNTYYSVGDEVTFSFEPSIDLDKIETAFGGGSLLLENGNQAAATSKFPTGNHPRSAFGVNKDRTKAIFMVVEGRGNSVGTDHNGMTDLMLEYGAYDAMHLDGGGSSTIVAQMPEDSGLQIQNVLSEGSERQVISVAGIFQDRPETDVLTSIKIVPEANEGLVNKSMSFQVFGLDEYGNYMEISTDGMFFDAIKGEGNWSGASFTPTNTGKFQVAVFYRHSDGVLHGAVTDFITISKTSKLMPTSDISLSGAGETATVGVQAVDTEGYTHWVSPYVTYEVLNRTIGTMDGNTFTAIGVGATQIKCTKDGQVAYVNVKVGEAEYLEKPSSSVASDPWRQAFEFANDGAFYINIVGDLIYNGSESIDSAVYLSNRDKWRVAVNSNGNLGIYGGESQINTAPSISIFDWSGGYKFLNTNGVSIAMVTSANGGVRVTDPNQYTYLARDIDTANNKNIVIITDKTPASFTTSGEADYFRNILSDYVKQGKNVFVAVNSGESFWTVVQDGVRYVNLPDLWKSDGTVNPDFSMIKMKISGSNIYYDIVK